MGEDDVQDRLGEVGFEAGDVLDLAAHLVIAERDLALQATGVGEVDRQRVVVVGLDLADVVEQGTGHRDVAVDAREEGGGGADRLGDRDGVLEQAVAVGLVVDLRRGRVAEARPDLRVLAEEAVEQVAQLGVLNRCQELTQVALDALEGDLGLGREVFLPILVRGRLTQAAELDLRAPALTHLEVAADVNRRARRGQRVELLGLLPATASPPPLASPRISRNHASPLRLRRSSRWRTA